MKSYRPGPLGSLMDEYERTIRELQEILRKLSIKDYERLSNPTSPDPDCLSVQTIMSHVISSGYGYATYIRNSLGVKANRPDIPLLSQADSIAELEKMFAYTLETFEGRWEMNEDQMLTILVHTRWSEYDIESMLEHAIVHILRHRRQIEKLMTL
ncbi:MAG: DinB family protein [Candidatus Kapaibacterium sp.]